jgi:hypothetical protein
MDRTEGFLATITFLLAALVYEAGDGTTPEFIAVPVILILFVVPIFVLGVAIVENLVETDAK